MHHTDICGVYDFPATSTDANELQILDGRTDSKGRRYGEPEDFWAHKSDAYFLIENE